jgi:hypothetical protein
VVPPAPALPVAPPAPVEPAAPVVPAVPVVPAAPVALVPAAPVLVEPAVPVVPAVPEPLVPALPVPVEPAPPAALPACPEAPPSFEPGVTLPQATKAAASESKQTRRKIRLGKLRMILIIRMVGPSRNPWMVDPRRATQSARLGPRKPSLLRGIVALALFVAPFGCKRDDRAAGVTASPPPAPAVPTPAARPPVAATEPAGADVSTRDAAVAVVWIDALRERDPGAVLDKTLLPFDFRDAHAGGHRKRCGTRVATTRAAAAGIATCLATDARLHAELSATPEPRFVAIGGDELPPWAKSWGKTIRPGLRALSTFVHGEADARELVLLVGDDGVHGVWQNLSIEPK